MFSARTSAGIQAVGFNPNMTTLPLKSRPNWLTYSSSAFNTAVPPCGKSFDQFIFCARDSSDRVEVLQMHRGNVRDHRLVRQRDASQSRNFARVRHPHLNHREIVFRLERQQPERQTKMIIEIALGAMHAILDREQVGHRLFGSRLAHRTGDADGRLAPHFSDRRRQRLERDESVVDGKQACRDWNSAPADLSEPPRAIAPRLSACSTKS